MAAASLSQQSAYQSLLLILSQPNSEQIHIMNMLIGENVIGKGFSISSRVSKFMSWYWKTRFINTFDRDGFL